MAYNSKRSFLLVSLGSAVGWPIQARPSQSHLGLLSCLSQLWSGWSPMASVTKLVVGCLSAGAPALRTLCHPPEASLGLSHGRGRNPEESGSARSSSWRTVTSAAFFWPKQVPKSEKEIPILDVRSCKFPLKRKGGEAGPFLHFI